MTPEPGQLSHYSKEAAGYKIVVQFLAGQDFSPCNNVWTSSGAPPYLLSTGYLEVKGLSCEDDHKSPSSAKAKNAWNYTTMPICVCIAWCITKYQEQLYTYHMKP
jgi:hypothetical protein